MMTSPTVAILALLFGPLVAPAVPRDAPSVHVIQGPFLSSIQAAIDVALPDDVLVLVGPFFIGDPIVVTKPLTLVGDGPSLVLLQDSKSFGPGSTDAATLTVAEGVIGLVRLKNLRLESDSIHSSQHEGAARAILSLSTQVELAIDTCELTGQAGQAPEGICVAGLNGAAGIEGVVGCLYVRDSVVVGGNGAGCYTEFPIGDLLEPERAGDGAPAIRVAGEVVLVRTKVIGGHGGDGTASQTLFGECGFSIAGTGADAVVATYLFTWGVTGSGGTGGSYSNCDGASFKEPDGLDPPPGPAARLNVASTGPLGGSVVLDVSVPAGVPLLLGASIPGCFPLIPIAGVGVYALGPDPFLAPYGPGPQVSVPLPNDPTILGRLVRVQVLFGTELTNPDFALITP